MTTASSPTQRSNRPTSSPATSQTEARNAAVEPRDGSSGKGGSAALPASGLTLMALATAGLAFMRTGKTRRQRREEARAAAQRAEDAKLTRAGADADSPTQMTAKGWKQVLLRTFKQISSDHVMLVAAGVTFYVLLALFPALAALVSIYGFFADPTTIQEQIGALQGVLPGGALEIIEEQLKTLASQDNSSLGLTFLIGLGVALWSANGGMKSIIEALNIAYEEVEKRGFVKLTLTAFAFTLGALLFVIVALFGVVAVPALIQNMALGPVVEPLMNWLRWPLMFVAVAGFITLIYRYGPSRDPAKWRWLTGGALLAAVLWVVVSVLFSWYVANFGSYNETYGSLGAAIGFMTWIWISTIIVLACAELNSELEHQTRLDTTTGPDEPMGQRGAIMADRVAGGPKMRAGRSDGF